MHQSYAKHARLYFIIITIFIIIVNIIIDYFYYLADTHAMKCYYPSFGKALVEEHNGSFGSFDIAFAKHNLIWFSSAINYFFYQVSPKIWWSDAPFYAKI